MLHFARWLGKNTADVRSVSRLYDSTSMSELEGLPETQILYHQSNIIWNYIYYGRFCNTQFSYSVSTNTESSIPFHIPVNVPIMVTRPSLNPVYDSTAVTIFLYWIAQCSSRGEREEYDMQHRSMDGIKPLDDAVM